MNKSILSKALVHASAILMCGVVQLPAQGRTEAIAAQWLEKIHALAPAQARASPKQARRVLVFSLATGFYHQCIPQTQEMVKALGEKSGAYETVFTKDIEQFRAENLSLYDAVVMNNTCPLGKDRDVFRDVLINKIDDFGGKYKDMPLEAREALAARFYRNLVEFVAKGGGLVMLHGSISSFNYSDEFSAIAGASFDYHPPQQEVVLNPVGDHPLLEPFGGKPFVHHDEPYLFNRAYPQMNFVPLLELDVANMEHVKNIQEIRKMKRYVAWIKPHEQGRVFYCSPSHNAESFEQPELLAFILGGIQYALGDMQCPDEPLHHARPIEN